MGRSPSTLSRELRRNGGARSYAHARVLTTVVKRKTRYALALPVKRRAKDAAARALKWMLAPLADCVRTIT